MLEQLLKYELLTCMVIIVVSTEKQASCLLPNDWLSCLHLFVGGHNNYCSQIYLLWKVEKPIFPTAKLKMFSWPAKRKSLFPWKFGSPNFIYICIYIFVYIYIFVCTYVYIFVCIYINCSTYTCVYTVLQMQLETSSYLFRLLFTQMVIT